MLPTIVGNSVDLTVGKCCETYSGINCGMLKKLTIAPSRAIVEGADPRMLPSKFPGTITAASSIPASLHYPSALRPIPQLSYRMDGSTYGRFLSTRILDSTSTSIRATSSSLSPCLLWASSPLRVLTCVAFPMKRRGPRAIV